MTIVLRKIEGSSLILCLLLQLRPENCLHVAAGVSFRRRENKFKTRKVYCSAEAPPPAWPGRAVAEQCKKRWSGPKPISIVGSTGSIGTQVGITPSIKEIFSFLSAVDLPWWIKKSFAYNMMALYSVFF